MLELHISDVHKLKDMLITLISHCVEYIVLLDKILQDQDPVYIYSIRTKVFENKKFVPHVRS